MKDIRHTMAWVSLIAVAALSGCADQTGRSARVEPRADQALRRMSAAVAGANAFSVRGTTTMDELLPTGQLVEFSRETRILVRRPDRLHAEIRRGDDLWLIWLADRTFTVLHPHTNTFASVRVPGHLDAVLDELAERHDLTMPLADLLFEDPYRVLTAEVVAGRFIGNHEVNGIACEHLLFTQEHVDWQIWIEAGKTALPRQILIDYKHLPGRPQFTALLNDWDLSADAGDDQFKPVLPRDAGMVELAQMLEARDKDE